MSKMKFITPLYTNANFRVNLKHVEKIEKTFYPSDNAAIAFTFISGKVSYWIYKSKESRDEEYDRIITCSGLYY